MYQTYENENQDSGNMAFVAGLCAGVAIGAGLGLLFAPRAGAELRGRLADHASTASRKVSETMDAVADAGRDAYSRARDVAATAGEELGRMAQDVSRSAGQSGAAIRSAAVRSRQADISRG
jgi:gas vesicle protein